MMVVLAIVVTIVIILGMVVARVRLVCIAQTPPKMFSVLGPLGYEGFPAI